MKPSAPPLSRRNLKTEVSRASVMFTLLAAIAVASVAQGRTITSSSSSSDILARIQWNSQAGLKPYRLQIARDEQFNDVMFDGVVNSQEYLVRDLDPGRYFWRVSSANPSLRQSLTVGRFEVRFPRPENRVPSKVGSNLIVSSGWLAATGEIAHPISGQLRSGYDADFLGTNSEGNVYALDSARGVALWIARYRLGAGSGKGAPARQFVPLILNPTTGMTLVVVAFENGLRALEGPTGKEVWRQQMEGIIGGLVVDLDATPGPEIYLTSEKNNKLLQIDPRTGQVASEANLKGKPVGRPVLLETGSLRAMMIPVEGNSIEIRKGDGELVRTIKLTAEVTTEPVVAQTARGLLMLVGTREGLVAIETTNFQPLGRITVEGGDYPIGSPKVADLDGDRHADVLIMLTNLGRAAAASLSDGLVKWSEVGFASATSAAFADLNGDGWLDVLLPGDDNFAVGLSGRDGSRVWDSKEPIPGGRAKSATRNRMLATATLRDGRTIVVGTDPSAIGLRAIEFSRVTNASPVK